MAYQRFPTAKSYVQDGLVAMWDGIENAGWGQHDANATVWKDLIGTRDLTAQNGAHFGANYADCAYGTVGPSMFTGNVNADSVLVVDMVVKSDFSKNTNLYRLSSTRFWQGLKARIILGSSRSTTPSLGLTSGTHEYQITVDYGSVASYINGQLYTSTGRDSNTFNGSGFSLGTESSSYYGGRIYRACLYSRTLTAAEIVANYAVDKERFNLP